MNIKNNDKTVTKMDGIRPKPHAIGSPKQPVTGAPGLKVILPWNDLNLAIKQAVLAAAVGNSWRDSLKIVADHAGVRFEASEGGLSSMYLLKAVGDVRIVQPGEACVSYGAIKQACSKMQKGRDVSLAYAPKVADGAVSTKGMVDSRHNLTYGAMEVASVGDGGATVCCRIESYPDPHFVRAEYPDVSNLCVELKGRATAIKEACGLARTAIDQSTIREVFRKLVISCTRRDISFVGSDGKRCAIANRSRSAFDEVTKAKTTILIDAKCLMSVLRTIPNEKFFTLATDRKSQHVYLYCGTARYRFSCPCWDKKVKYPNFGQLLKLPLGTVFLADRKELAAALKVLLLVHGSMCAFSFSNNGSVVVSAKGIDVVGEARATVRCRLTAGAALKKPLVHLNLRYLLDCVSMLNADNVKLSFACDEMRVKIEDETNPKFRYFMQVVHL